MLNFENLDKFIFDGVGKYNIPKIQPVFGEPLGNIIPMNYAKTEKDPDDKILHCFVDDYQFTRYWNRPEKYIPMLQKFKAVCAPDFSTYTDMPLDNDILKRLNELAEYECRPLSQYINLILKRFIESEEKK